MATNFIDYGNKAVENGIIDGGKHEILYFHAGSNNDWFNSANWYYDNAFTIPANKYPDSDDIVYIVDENVSSSKNTIIQIDYLSVTRTGYGAYWGNSLNLEWGTGLKIECSYGAAFNNLSDYDCGYLKNYANITAPTITFNLSSNYGTLNGATVFAYNYGPCENFGNFGTVNGTASFNSGGDTYWYSVKNYGTVYGNATFYNNAANASIINGNVNFYNYSASFGGQINGNSNFNDYSWVENATLSGNVNFYTGSYATSCSIFGNVFLYNSSYISYSTIYGDVDSSSNSYYYYANTINGNVSLTSSSGFYNSTINGDVVLNDYSYIDGTTVNGDVTANAYTYTYYCTINGLVELNNLSYSQYCTVSNVSLFGSSYINDSYVSNDLVANNNSSFAYNTIIDSITLNNNARSVSSNSAASATFNDNSSNDNCNLTCPSVIFNDYSSNASSSTVTGNATFNNYSDNNGTVTGNATFNDASDNNGTVSGTVTCNTTGVCGTPSGSSTNSDLALLMHFDGPDFTDSSLHRSVITSNGNASISSAQSKFGGASGYFDGTGGTLAIAASDLFFELNDFTVETWLYCSSFSPVGAFDRQTIAAQWAGGGSYLWMLEFDAQNIVLTQGNNGFHVGQDFVVPWSPTPNTWQHVAVSRENGVVRMFLNGQLLQSGTCALNMIGTANLVIGKNPDNNTRWLNGYIDELRIVKGAALYTSNFTPPSAPYQDPEPPNPSLLMHFDGTSFVDSSLNNHTITNNGASLSSGESKFGGSSGYFDGSSQLTIPLSSSLEFNTGDFTIETWVYLTSLSSDTFVTSPINNGGWFFGFDGNLHLGFGRKFVAWDLNAPDTIPTNTWIHIAATRQQGTLRLFINGMKSAEMPNNLIDYSLSGADMVIGSHYNSMWLSGYIDELRIIKGKALYTSNFMPPTAPTPNPIVPDLLLSFEGSDGSSSFVDSSPNALTITTNGSLTISTSQKRIGGSSGYFNDASSLSLSSYPSFMSGSDDFTIECWIYLNDTGWNGICGSSDPGSLVLATANGDIWLGTANLGPPDGWTVTATGVLSINTWYHVAAVRSAGEMKIFVNGILKNTITETRPFAVSSSFSIGNLSGEGGWYLNGYIDELRIVKGTALYTTNFNPF